jgi:LysR family transcriptional activator of nhaA
MEWLNYHHLLYFWVVFREGSVTKASQVLNVAQPTISGQLRALEERLGEKLFVRTGRTLALTEVGRVVHGYAEAIFGLGRELVDVVAGRAGTTPRRLRVGIADAVPKRVAWHLLQPVLELPEPPRLICQEEPLERLVALLVGHELDVVLSDAPAPLTTKGPAFNHLLGESGTSILGTRTLVEAHPGPFPTCLQSAPFLLPTVGATLRLGLDLWFESQGLQPHIVGEFEDSALISAFGEQGAGFFAVPTVIEALATGEAQVVGRVDSLRERYYAISGHRRLTHPAVLALSSGARNRFLTEGLAILRENR